MDKKLHNDNFLARWAEGQLSESEKTDFEKTKDFQAYQAILNGTNVLEVPKFDRASLFNKIQQNKQQTTKVKRLPLLNKWAFVVAASVALIVGYVLFFNNTVNFTTDYGEQLAITLPDNSKVMLNAKSKLFYNKSDWESKRNLNLEGEAYFEVTKGKTFSVKTHQGTVTVLGTQFSVNADDTTFEVICYEGKVKVTHATDTRILTKGKALRLIAQDIEDWELTTNAPSWLQQKSTFNNTPLKQVITALEKQYDVVIDASKIDISAIRYTGGFTHNDLDKALKTVFQPLKIKFTFGKKNIIFLAKK